MVLSYLFLFAYSDEKIRLIFTHAYIEYTLCVYSWDLIQYSPFRLIKNCLNLHNYTSTWICIVYHGYGADLITLKPEWTCENHKNSPPGYLIHSKKGAGELADGDDSSGKRSQRTTVQLIPPDCDWYYYENGMLWHWMRSRCDWIDCDAATTNQSRNQSSTPIR